MENRRLDLDGAGCDAGEMTAGAGDDDPAPVYVSITGLRLKTPFHAAWFWWHAIRSMMQAQAAPGNLRAEARAIGGVQHTLTVWTNRTAMRRFLITGAHVKAMRAFPRIATGSTFGFETDTVPDWGDIHRLWHERGIVYGERQAEPESTN